MARGETYEEFIEKFKTKKTTDDCYTPPDVYNNAVSLFEKITGINTKERNIIRPFYPGGDYEHYDYKPGDIVLDNPPFSIISKIINFYNAHGVNYFLFGPERSLFSTKTPGYVIVYKSVIYDNGADVATGFYSNMFNGIYTIKSIQNRESKQLKKTILPDGYETAATMRKYANSDEMHFYKFDANSRIRKTPEGKGIYGCAYKVEKIR